MPGEKPNNQERIKEIMIEIENGIQDLFQSGKLESYLKTMSKFHRYSLNNTILIYLQRPDATYCAGFQTWKNEFGRHVKKGEKGIKILAPAPFKKTVRVEKLDPVTHAPVRDASGQAVMEEQTIQVPHYKTVMIFDLSQTEGPPLPELAAELTGDVQQYDAFMEALRRTSPVPIEIRPIEQSVDGFFSRETQSITIREGMSQAQTVCVALHELAHSIRHNDEQGKEKSRAVKEVEAESCAMAVSSYYSLDTSATSIPYLSSYSRDRSLPELRSSLQIIMETVDQLITDIDRHFAAVCRERGIAVPKRLGGKAESRTFAQSQDSRPDTAAVISHEERDAIAESQWTQESSPMRSGRGRSHSAKRKRVGKER